MTILDPMALWGIQGMSPAQRDALIMAAPFMLNALKTTSHNISSLTAAGKCNTYNEWQAMVDTAIQMAEVA